MKETKATFTNIAIDVISMEDQGNSNRDFSEDQEPSKPSYHEVIQAAKSRLKLWEKSTYVFLIVLGVISLFAFWPVGLLFIGFGFYFRHLAIGDHKNAILFEKPALATTELRPEFEVIVRPMTTTKRFLFWVCVAYIAVCVVSLVRLIYIETSFAGAIGSTLAVCVLCGPAYFACRKLEPAYTLSMLFNAKERADFRTREQDDMIIAMHLKKEKDEQAYELAELRRVEAEDRAKERATEREVERARERVRRDEEQARQEDIKRRQEIFLQSVQTQCEHAPVIATVIGGSGMPVDAGEVLWVSCRSDTVALSRIARQQDYTIPYSTLVNAEVSGPGTETSSAGIMGGGFGLEGAAKGILIATVINALTSSSKTNTFLRLSTDSGEVHLRITTLEPNQLRLVLSPLFVKIESGRVRITSNSLNGPSLASELEKLNRLRSDGVLTEEEFATAKKKLLA
jgi:hypothetical protein